MCVEKLQVKRFIPMGWKLLQKIQITKPVHNSILNPKQFKRFTVETTKACYTLVHVFGMGFQVLGSFLIAYLKKNSAAKESK